MTIKVNETFSGIQGEGLTTGLPVYFVRLAGCNLNCDFCDTKYHKVKSLDTMHTVLNKIRNSGIDDIVFTGGEPMLQINEINKLKHYLPHHTFHLETNGTIYDKRIDQFRFISCSPKKQAVIDKNSDELDSYKKINGQVLSSFKFVYENKNDDWWIDFINKVGIEKGKVWIMPEGATRTEQLKKMPEVMKYCLDTGFSFSPRLQVLAYNNRRGV